MALQHFDAESCHQDIDMLNVGDFAQFGAALANDAQKGGSDSFTFSDGDPDGADSKNKCGDKSQQDSNAPVISFNGDRVKVALDIETLTTYSCQSRTRSVSRNLLTKKLAQVEKERQESNEKDDTQQKESLKRQPETDVADLEGEVKGINVDAGNDDDRSAFQDN